MYIISLIIIFILTFFIGFSLARSNKERKHCELNEYTIETEKNIDNFSFLFLSDFHNSANKSVISKLDEILEKNKNIDAVLSAGDMITYRPKRKRGINFDNFIKLLDICKKYSKNFIYGYGNHEDRFIEIDTKYKKDEASFNQYKEELNKYNIIELINANTNIIKNINVYDIDYDKKFYKNNLFYKNIKKRLSDEIIRSLVGEIDNNKYNIILSHNPDYAERLIEYGFDLVLSGHQHGGLVRLPIIGAVISPELTFFPPYTRGHYKYLKKDIVVSGGLGEHTFKIRINNLPEIIKIKINKIN